jgi:uncharacterized surface protein with fasciclin (FAS1) repeats
LQAPAGTVDSLLKPKVGQTEAVLTYHVVAGKFDAATVIDAINKITENTVLQPFREVYNRLSEGKMMLIDANVNSNSYSCRCSAASNGVIHAIDTVVMPK